jgi:hypothetical protein
MEGIGEGKVSMNILELDYENVAAVSVSTDFPGCSAKLLAIHWKSIT